MMIHRWLEKPRALAALTLAFALVPVVFAYVTFRSARERDAKLAETATQVLGEQLSLSTFKHVSFLNILRNQWRYVSDPAHPLRSHLPPPGWMDRFSHLRAVAFVMHEEETRLPIRWQEGRSPVHHLDDNLADDSVLADAMKHARLSSTPVAFGARVSPDLLAVIHAVPRENDNSFVRGYLIAWIDLGSMCRDTSLPLLKSNALRASTAATPESKAVSIGEGDTTWTAWIARGAGFTREYGTPTPWVGFAALGLSVLPLSVLVMLASRAAKLRAALEAEREVVRLRTHFLHSVSHEFRTPLSVIQSATELIEHYADQLPPERRAKALAQINDSTRHMNEMVEQVLTLSRIESHQLPIHLKPVRLRELLSEVATTIRTTSDDRCPIELKCEESLEINSDASVLRSILLNLIGNAVKYSRDGGSITIAADPSKVIVRDQGCGIAADDLPRVCEPFHRGSNTGYAPGTGLGLAIASKCAALLGSTLQIESIVGEGTTVTLHLKNQES